jgi:hypothetical protein
MNKKTTKLIKKISDSLPDSTKSNFRTIKKYYQGLSKEKRDEMLNIAKGGK